MINGFQLIQLAPKLSQSKANEIAGLLDSICPKYGINTPDIFHEFIANLLHECAEFTRFEEGLNYQAVALTKKFGRHRISIDDCYRYGRTMKQKANQQAIANTIYGGEWGRVNLGNTQPGDGWLLRGGGPMQLTGRKMYGDFTAYYNKNFVISGNAYYTIEQMSALVKNNLSIAIHSACWVFAISKKLIDEAIADDILTIRKKINGGTFGMDDVKKYLAKAVAIIK